MTSGSLNLPEDRTPSVLDREAIWKMVKRSNGLVIETGDQPILDHEVDEKLTDEVCSTFQKMYIKKTWECLQKIIYI